MILVMLVLHNACFINHTSSFLIFMEINKLINKENNHQSLNRILKIQFSLLNSIFSSCLILLIGVFVFICIQKPHARMHTCVHVGVCVCVCVFSTHLSWVLQSSKSQQSWQGSCSGAIALGKAAGCALSTTNTPPHRITSVHINTITHTHHDLTMWSKATSSQVPTFSSPCRLIDHCWHIGNWAGIDKCMWTGLWGLDTVEKLRANTTCHHISSNAPSKSCF